MVKKYRRNCNYCGKYYEGYGKNFCSLKCSTTFLPRGFKKGNQYGKLNKGNKGWNKGLTEETDERVRKGTENLNKTLKEHPEIRKNAGKKISGKRKKLFKEGKLSMSKEIKRKFKEFSIKPKSEDHKRKIGESNRITKQKPEIKEKMRIANLGSKNPMFGKHPSKKWKEWRKTKVFPIKDTSIEIKIQKFLSLFHLEFYTHKYMNIKNGYQCDILIPEQEGIAQKMIIECDGCYWHGCKKCNKEIGEWQEERIKRDRLRTQELQKEGYKVIRLWGHEIRAMEQNQFKSRIKSEYEIYKPSYI